MPAVRLRVGVLQLCRHEARKLVDERVERRKGGGKDDARVVTVLVAKLAAAGCLGLGRSGLDWLDVSLTGRR